MTQDTRFQKFKDELAFHVMDAINNRDRIIGSPLDCSNRNCCPLGAHRSAISSYPPSDYMANLFDLPTEYLRDFIDGWGTYLSIQLGANSDTTSKYWELGRAYRKKFIHGPG